MSSTRLRMRHAAAAVVVGCLLVTTGIAARAAAFTCACDATLGFSQAPPASGQTHPVGYMNSATIAGTTLTPDIRVRNVGTGATVNVVAVMQSDSWAGGASDPISITAYVSKNNATALQALVRQSLSTMTVTFDFANYAWDAAVSRYYESLGPSSPPLRGVLKSGTLSVAATPVTIAGGSYYSMKMTPSPASGGPQNLTIASSSSTRAVQAWGM